MEEASDFCLFRVFEGRERELDLLRRGLENANCGQGGVFLVSASQGIGKTSLMEQLNRDAQNMGFHSVFASPRLEENSNPIPTTDSESYIESLVVTTLSFQKDLGSEREGCESLLKKTSINRPVLLIFEDIHRWNTKNLSFLAVLARNIKDTRCFVVATYSEKEIGCDPLKRLRFSDLARVAFHITLTELDEIATGKLAQALLGHEIDLRLAREIFRATGGNPLIVKHTLQAWSVNQESVRKDQFEADTILIPFPIRDLFRSWLGELSATGGDILRAAAVFNGAFSPDLLARVSGLAGRELFDAMDEAERVGLLEKDPDLEGHFRFRHSLLRELLYRSVSTFQRAELHRRAARAIEAVGGLTPSVACKIVDHLHRALNQSGCDGQINGSFEGGAAEETRARAEFLVWFGENQIRIGAFEAAVATLMSASKLAERLGDTTLLAKISLALPNHFVPLPGAPNFEAILLAKNVLNGGQTLDAGLRAQVCARLAAELSYLPEEFDRAQRLMNEALEAANSYPPAVQLQIRLYRDALLRGPEALDQRIDNACALGDLAVGIDDGAAAHFGFLTKAIAHLERGETSCAQSAWHFAVAAAGVSPGPSEKLSLAAYRAARAFCENQLPETRAFLCEAEAAATDGAPREFTVTAQALASRELALFPEAREAAQFLAERWPGTAMYCALLALTELDLGQERDARFHFEKVFGDGFLHLPRNETFLPCGALLAELCVELHDLQRAARLYSTLIPYGSHFAVMGQGLILGPLSLHLGILALALKQLELAQQHLEEALRMSRSGGLRIWAAYTNYHLAQCLALRDDDSAEVQSHRYIEEALAEAEALGTVRLLKRVRSSQESTQSRTAMRWNGSSGPNESPNSGGSEMATVTDPARMFKGLECCEETETYLLSYRERILRLRKSKGLKLMLTLVRDPGREFHVLDLECAAGNSHGRDHSSGEGGPQLDATAKQSYRTRLQDLREDLQEAQSFNDSHRVSMIEEEIGFLARELARAVGLKGADRKTFSDAERARVRVTQAIHSALRKISDQDAVIGWYLAKAIRTGTFCSFHPFLQG